ncbi:MAG: cytochrome P450 [Tepidiformaceae bacterium]
MAFFNPFRPAYNEDPYPSLALLRAQEPVHRSADLNAWIVTSYELCNLVLHDDEAFSSDPTHASGGFGASVIANRAQVPLGLAPIMGNSDDPDHLRLRTIVNRAFTPRVIADMRPVIEATVEDVLGQAPDGPLEVMSDFAEPLAVTTVLEHLGVPPEDRQQMRAWSLALMRARAEGPGDPAVLAAAAEARDAIIDYLQKFTPANGRRSIISTVTSAAAAGEALTAEEMAMLLIHISLAGNGPSAYAIANSTLALARHPEQLALLASNPELLPSAVEELLRFDSPTHIVARFAIADTKLGARTVHAGDILYAVIAAANRDPAQFPDPDILDIERQHNRHLSFGIGIHVCLGAPLARLELQIALGALIKRYGVFRPGYVDRGGTLLLRGPRVLVIEPGD